MNDFTIDEYKLRISRLQEILKVQNIGIAVLSQATDIYYYTGSVQPLYLIIPSVGKSVALLRKALTRSQNEIKHMDTILFKSTLELGNKLSEYDINKIAFTFDTLSYATVKLWQTKFNLKNIVDISWDIRMLRTVKSEKEIEIISKAGTIVSAIPELIKEVFKHDMTELELSAEIEKYLRLNESCIVMKCRREGVECIGVCSAGENSLQGTKFEGISAGKGLSPAFPYGAANNKITEGIPCLVDFGFNYKGYHIDQTRMFSYKTISSQILNVYESMVRIEENLFKLIKPDVKWYEVYEYSLKLASEMGFEKEFMGIGSDKVKFVGHGVGLELDEPPFLADKMNYKIKKGNVLAVEPKVSIPGIGVIGIEDTIEVTDDGVNILTNAPREFMIIN